MSTRELVVLGTAGMSPTRARNHHALLLRLDGEEILIDCGEGTQRQFAHLGRSPSHVGHVLLTHLHGDHCLGVPGLLARRHLDHPHRPVTLTYPAESDHVVGRLLDCTADRLGLEGGLTRRPVPPSAAPAAVGTIAGFRLEAATLDHPVPTVGYRLVEPDRRRYLPERLAAAGIRGPDIGRLDANGHLSIDGRRITVDEVSEPRRGLRIAFVFDTRRCPAAEALADGADLLVCESTFAEGEESLAEERGHLTAGQAGRLAAEAGVGRLVLCHYSGRHADEQQLAAQARRYHPEVIAASDLEVIEVPSVPG